MNSRTMGHHIPYLNPHLSIQHRPWLMALTRHRPLYQVVVYHRLSHLPLHTITLTLHRNLIRAPAPTLHRYRETQNIVNNQSNPTHTPQKDLVHWPVTVNSAQELGRVTRIEFTDFAKSLRKLKTRHRDLKNNVASKNQVRITDKWEQGNKKFNVNAHLNSLERKIENTK